MNPTQQNSSGAAGAAPREEQACRGRRDMRTLFDEARKAGRVVTPAHVRKNRTRKRELDLMRLES
jgi:hypothetical protein